MASEVFLARLRYWLASGRHRDLHRLRDHHEAQGLAAAQPERHGSLQLATADREDTGAQDLADEGGIVERQPDQQRRQLRRDHPAAREAETGRPRHVEGGRHGALQRHGDDRQQEQQQTGPERRRHTGPLGLAASPEAVAGEGEDAD
jgi:hypothetical protein